MKIFPKNIFFRYSRFFSVKCENAEHGCTEIVRLDNLVEHSAQCEFNPKRPIPCESCEMEIPKNQIKNHNCIRDLRKQGKKIVFQFDADVIFSFGSSNTRRIIGKR